MLTTLLLLTVSAVPQGPASAMTPRVTEALRELDQLTLGTRIERRVRAHRRGTLAPIRAPGFARSIRESGREVLDVALDAVRMPDPDADPLGVFELARRMWGFDGTWRRVPRGLDLDGFEDLLEEAQRDVLSAIGSGRSREDTARALTSGLQQLLSKRWGDVVIGEAKAPLFRDNSVDAVDRLAGVDQRELLQIARWIVAAAFELVRADYIETLRARPPGTARSGIEALIEGTVLADSQASFGRIVIGGPGPNKYDCNRIDVIIDLGGDDEYTGRAGGAAEFRELAVVIDLAGNDRYECLNDGLGSGTFGLGLLIDVAGDDQYSGKARCGGYGAGGIGVLMDLSGDDRFEFEELSAGASFGGTGIFVDMSGNDHHVARELSFGCGLPGGLGLFIDRSGNDERSIAGRSVVGGIEEQDAAVGGGAGLGLLPFLDGGLGVFLDGSGDDTFTATGGLVFGAGAHGGAGIYRDVRGRDSLRGGLYSFGAAFADGVGVHIDEEGDDRGFAGSHSFGAASEASLAAFLDIDGNDLRACAAPAFGLGRAASFGMCLDLDGLDKLSTQEPPSVLAFGQTRRSLGIGLGLYLHERGADDDYSGVKSGPPFANGTRTVPEFGSGKDAWRRVIVDR